MIKKIKDILQLIGIIFISYHNSLAEFSVCLEYSIFISIICQVHDFLL